jgi:hypothetical protein
LLRADALLLSSAALVLARQLAARVATAGAVLEAVAGVAPQWLQPRRAPLLEPGLACALAALEGIPQACPAVYRLSPPL